MPNEEHVSPEAPGGAEVTFVNRFTVLGPAEEFEEVFDRTSAFMARQPGFVRHTLLREVDDPARYVNLAVWRDRDSFRRAVGHPDFVPHATALRSLSLSENGLYAARLSRAAADGTDRPVRTGS